MFDLSKRVFNSSNGALRRQSRRIKRQRRCESLEDRLLLSTTPPSVEVVQVSSEEWSTAFISHLQSQGASDVGYAVPEGLEQADSLPWHGINQIHIRFSEDVTVDPTALSMRGLDAASYALDENGFAYDGSSRTATWTLVDPLPNDRILLTLDDSRVIDIDGNLLDGEWLQAESVGNSGNGVPGGNFRFQINVVPGDVNQSGGVSVDDVAPFRTGLGSRVGSGAYSIFADLNGSGSIAVNDLGPMRVNLGDTLPVGDFEPAGISSVSPANGETMVNVTRESIVRFTEPVVPESVTTETFEILANGESIPGSIRVSSTERFATFFYDNPLPASTEVRIVIDGDGIMGRDGQPLDADGDRQPGGDATADFRTLSLSQVPNTELFGFVKDSQNGAAIEGVTISLEAFPEISATTDETGFFELGTQDLDEDGIGDGLPTPEFFVHIDGSAATTSGGRHYTSLGKPFHSTPGQREQLNKAGTPFDIFLPPIAADAAVQITPGNDTEVGFGQSDLTMLTQMFPDIDPSLFDNLAVMIPDGSAIDETGQPAGEAFVVPVDPDFLPAPLPSHLSPKLVVSVQTPGATNFDTPAPVTFPNLDGLSPGEKTLFWSFDHDAGEWKVIGTGTVSESGTAVISDPGVGILAPGWHFQDQGTRVRGSHRDALEREFFPEGTRTSRERAEAVQTVMKESGDIIGEVLDNVKDLNPVTRGVGKALDLAGDAQDVRDGDYRPIIDRARPKNPLRDRFDSIESAKDSIEEAAESAGTINDLLNDARNRFGNQFQILGQTGGSLLDQAIASLNQFIQDLQSIKMLLDAFISDANVIFSIAAESNESQPMAGLTQAQINTYVDRLLSLDGTVTVLEQAPNLVPRLLVLADQIEAGLLELLADLTANNQGQGSLGANAYVAAEYEGRVERIRATASGQWEFVVPANVAVKVTLFNPRSNTVKRIATFSPDAGDTVDVGAVPLLWAEVFEDTDEEALVDRAEFAVGTSATQTDTDADGVNDAAEVFQGLDPLGARAFPTGLIASLPLFGEAKSITVKGSTLNAESQQAYIATGSHGIAIVDVSQFDNPIVLGQLDLLGDATDIAVDSRTEFAAVATNTGGLQIVDISDPMLPTLAHKIEGSFTHVEVADGVAFATQGLTLRAIDLLTGERLNTLDLSGTANVTGMARDGQFLYLMDTAKTLRVIDVANGLGFRGSVIMSNGGGRLFVGGEIAYAAAADTTQGGFATADVSDPDNPVVISGTDAPVESAPGTDIVTNGSGLGLLVGQSKRINRDPSSLAILDVANPDNTYEFLTRVDLRSPPTSVAVASGIAFVTDATGLKVINYLAFDSQGVAPTVSVSTSADIDPGTPGVQVEEGATLPLLADIVDDVQIRNVELLVDGQVVQNSVSFPFDLAPVAPVLPNGVTSDTATIQVRVTDTGGNTTSEELSIDVVPDTSPPAVVSSSPIDGAIRGQNFRTIRVTFSEPIDDSNPLDHVMLRGSNGNELTAVDAQLRSNDSILQLTFESLAPDDYSIVVDESRVTDRAGNPIGGNESIAGTFTVLDADIVWTNPDGGFWDDVANWDTGELPEAGDVVLIPFATDVTVRGSVLRDLHILGEEATNLRFNASDGTLDGVVLGVNTTLLNGAIVTVLNDLTLDDITLRLERTVSNNPNNTIDVRLNFSGGDQILGGVGDVELFSAQAFSNQADDVSVRSTNGGSLTIGSGITVRNAANSRFTSIGEGSVPVTIEGTVSSQSPGQTLLITGSTVTNHGTLQLVNGHLNLNNVINNQPIEVPIDTSLTLQGDWNNVSTVNQTGGTVNLQSAFTIDDLGVFTGATGTVNINGILDDPGDTLLVDDRTWQLSGGQIKGVTIDGTDVASLFQVTSADGTLDGVTLSTNTTLLNGAIVTVLNDLTLDDITLRLERTVSNNPNNTIDVRLNFSGGDQILGGIGDVELFSAQAFSNQADDVSVRSTNGGSLTIGSGISVRNAANSRFTSIGEGSVPVTIEGTVSSESPGQTLLITGSTVTNHGTLQLVNGHLNLNNVINNQPIEVPIDTSLTLQGDWNNVSTVNQTGGTVNLQSTFTIDDLGVFTGATGTVNINGILDDPGDTLLVDDRTWQLSGGQIKGVTIDGIDVASLFQVTSADGTLDGVTLSTNTTLLNGAIVTVLNDLTLDDITLRLERTVSNNPNNTIDVRLNFSGGDQILGGVGDVELFSAQAFSNQADDVSVRSTNGGSLTIGSGISVRNAANSRFTSIGEGSVPVTIEGTVSSESPGQTLLITGSTVTNHGTLQLVNGHLNLNNVINNQPIEVPIDTSLTLQGDWNNVSTVNQTGGTVNLQSTFTIDDLGVFTGATGTVNINGILDDPGDTLLVDDRTWQLSGGQIKGVTIDGIDVASLFQVTSADGTLDGVTLSTNTTLLNGAIVTVLNDLTLDDITLRLERTVSNNPNNTIDVRLNFSGGDQILGGVGDVELFSAQAFSNQADDVSVRSTNGGSLTIGSGITVRNAANSRFTSIGEGSVPVTIEGTVSSESPGQTLLITGSTVTNHGTLQLVNGHLNLNNVINNQPIEVPIDTSLTLQGDWNNVSTVNQTGGTVNLQSTFTIDDLGVFTGATGTVNINGILDDPGDTLLVDDRTWQLSGGQIKGVTIDGTDVASLFQVTSADGTLDGVTLSTNTTLLSGAIVTVLNDLTLDDITLRLERTVSNNPSSTIDVRLNFSGGDQILGGVGDVELFSAQAFSNQADDVSVRSTNGGSLTIGSGISVRNAANSRFTSIGEGSVPVTIEGTVSSESPGQTIRVTGSVVTNNGTLRASSGTLSLVNLAPNAASLHVEPGARIEVSGDLSLSTTSDIKIDVAGLTASDLGRITVLGEANFLGDLNVSFLDFSPSSGDSFELFSYNTANGLFDAVNATGLPTDLAMNEVYRQGNLTIDVTTQNSNVAAADHLFADSEVLRLLLRK